MLIILSQRIDTDSDYSDEVFETYHYPSRYKNQIHEGDTFVYYQGNRYVKEQRYYYGVGTIGQITTFDDENYYGYLFPKTIFNAYSSGKITMGEMCRILNVKSKHISGIEQAVMY